MSGKGKFPAQFSRYSAIFGIAAGTGATENADIHCSGQGLELVVMPVLAYRLIGENPWRGQGEGKKNNDNKKWCPGRVHDWIDLNSKNTFVPTKDVGLKENFLKEKLMNSIWF